MFSLLALASVACSARAEDATDYPSKKIKMLLPFGAGGGGDVLGRLLADRMGNRLGQTIYVENRTGAAGTIGAQQAATSPPDGYTITIGGMTTHVLAPAVYPNLPYDPIKDFAPVAMIGSQPYVLVLYPGLPAQDMAQLIALAKAKPGVLNYGSFVNQQALQMDDFAQCIATGRGTPVPGEMGRRDLTIIEAIYRAAASGKRELVKA
jgi:tripartite-type tricarboxylate transporter receptor subunit TctC